VDVLTVRRGCDARTDLTATRDKYASKKFSEVALIPAPVSL
jgi:hypothetical protein